MNVGLVLLMVHLVWCLAMWLVIETGHLKVDTAALVLTLFIPFFGTIALLVADHVNRHGQSGVHMADIESMRASEVRKRVSLQVMPEQRNIVPLEDVLTIGSSSERREAMLDVLMQDNPEGLPDFSEAQENADPEVVHYATTAMTEMASNFEVRLAQAKKVYDANPDSADALNAFIEENEQYLGSSAANGTIRRIHEQEYKDLLIARFKRRHDVSDAQKIAKIMMDTGDFDEANAVISMMEKRFPNEAVTIGERLRYDFETGRGRQLHRTIRDVKNSGRFIPDDLMQLMDFWDNADNG